MKKYHTLIPLVLNALDGQQSEDLIAKVFETFNEFVEFKKVLGPYLPNIIEKALNYSSDSEMSTNLREQTMFFIGQVSATYSKMLIKQHGMGFVDKILEQGFKIASEDPEMYQGQEETPPEMAVEMITSWAVNVNVDKMWPIIKKHLQTFGTSKEEHERAAATLVLSAVTDNEACLVAIRDEIDILTNFLVDRMADSSFAVREAAGECCGKFSELVGEDFLGKHQKLMPFLIKLGQDMLKSTHENAIIKTLFGMNEFI